ncbi:MAG: DEAD/DEAH box helicase family protein, partial [Nitrospirota bacterium]|nr:DEAD/DEAH box helicase family protein [Nitrospirota bacterium]
MILRPRQKELVERSLGALHQHGNTLAVAPTGSGKTIMLS